MCHSWSTIFLFFEEGTFNLRYKRLILFLVAIISLSGLEILLTTDRNVFAKIFYPGTIKKKFVFS